MRRPPVRWLALGAGVVLLLLAAMLIRNRAPEIQAPATFERIAQAFADADAADVVAQLHPRYDFASEWPAYFGSGAETGIAADNERDYRAMARRGIAVIFLQRGDNRLRFSYRIARIEPQPDGTVVVEATIDVGSSNGSGKVVAPAPRRWVLARDGWLTGRLKIVSHDRIDVSL
jgi:hypothetical protein